ncbi:hypothetical protein AB0L88_37650 [Saccharopolyspora shandongensis]|uniref:hypothetical protein n=1 Tax=Saccharopolyspora shandongensis TaxID=418495 RepID=UPI0034266668
MHITAHTQPSGDKPNEDWFAASDGLVVVLDGATIRTDTGCIHGLPWYVRTLGAGLVANAADHARGLRDVLADSIRQVTAAHSGSCDLEHRGTPSAAVGLVRWTSEAVEWIVLGDITVIVETTDDAVVTCDDRVSRTGWEERRACDRFLIGTDEKMAAILAMKEIELASRNREGGYWIASSNPGAAAHSLTGSAPVGQVERVAVCSDGAMRALDLTPIDTTAGVLRVLREAGPDGLVGQVRAAEDGDPLGARVPRNKARDDATAVLVETRYGRENSA